MSDDGGPLYHGLNFAAYGGKVNRFAPGGYTNAINAINSTGNNFHYVINGQKMNREEAINYIQNHQNEHYVVNRYGTTASTAGTADKERNWQTLGNDGTWIDNNEYYPKEGNLDEIVVTTPYNINNSLSQDRTYLQHNPIADLNVTMPVDFTNTDQNMFHRRDVERGDTSVRDALSSDVVDHIYDYMMPSTWAGAADKLFDHDENGDLKYNFFRDFNRVFNPTYDNQGFVGLFGADEWADEHPEATAGINFATDLLLPVGIKGVKRANFYNIANTNLKGNNFTSRLVLDALNPDVSIWRATRNGSYPWVSKIESNRIGQLASIAENAKNDVLARVQQSLIQSPYLKPNLTMEEIAEARELADNVPIRWIDQSWYRNPKTKEAFGQTSSTYINGPTVSNPEAWGTAPNPNDVIIDYPLFKGAKTNVMYSPSELETVGELGTPNINAAIYHEPVHAAQHVLYPTFFGEQGAPVFSPFKESNGNILVKANPRTNQKFVANDIAMDLASEPTYGPGVTYSGQSPNANYIEITNEFPWNRKWSELDAEIQGFKAKNKFPALIKNLSQEQKQLLVKHIGDKFDLDYRKAERFINRNALYGF